MGHRALRNIRKDLDPDAISIWHTQSNTLNFCHKGEFAWTREESEAGVTYQKESGSSLVECLNCEVILPHPTLAFVCAVQPAALYNIEAATAHLRKLLCRS